MPQQLLPLPEPSPLMAGMFLLRGRLVPVLDLQRLMAPAAPPSAPPPLRRRATGWIQMSWPRPRASRRRQVAVVVHGGR